MSQDLITVVTATVGDSQGHLHKSMTELRRHTSVPFTQIVSDDGTLDEGVKKQQRDVVQSFDRAAWTENLGPVYGISYNLNRLFYLAPTPWVFVLEDAVRPGQGWLETALDALEQIGMRRWGGHEVGGIGLVSSFDHWELEVAGLLPGHLGLAAYFGACTHETIGTFWSDWNDGLICWPRLLPAIQAACRSPEAESWPGIIQETWRRPILAGEQPGHPSQWFNHKSERYSDVHWPQARRAWPATTPGSWGLINKAAWLQVGRWRDGCCFYEGHLGVRLAQQGYVSVNINNPPWLHYPSMAFNAIHNGHMGKQPRHHEPDNGPHGIFERDFGCNGEGHCELRDLVLRQYTTEAKERMQDELAQVEIYMDPAWLRWL
jgi:hypothetical protein